jgi:hypothetical protein
MHNCLYNNKIVKFNKNKILFNKNNNKINNKIKYSKYQILLIIVK